MHFQKRKVWEEVLHQLLCLEPDLAIASEQLVSTGVATDLMCFLLGLVVPLALVRVVLVLILLLLVLFLLLVLVVHLILVVLILVVLVVVPFLLRALGLDPHPSFYAICDDFSF